MQDRKKSGDRLLARPEVGERIGLSRRFLEVSAVRGDGPADGQDQPIGAVPGGGYSRLDRRAPRSQHIRQGAA
ncbi:MULTISPECIES: hypothetical protein [unclassified Haematobacter]|uniref:hypothetical protein n=1 Tax=unclassified Haematobacter TaxID=2640585 RepID=UPI0025B80292|nr:MULTISPECIES: hypothetical protein [unclassified Haematobacter]